MFVVISRLFSHKLFLLFCCFVFVCLSVCGWNGIKSLLTVTPRSTLTSDIVDTLTACTSVKYLE